MITKIISGGQSGCDRAALQFAIDNNIEHGGWCPKGRLAEDGPIPTIYNLIQTKSDKYPPRTEMNVKNSDATIIFNHSGPLERGCILTYNLCLKHDKPWIVLENTILKKEINAANIERFIQKNQVHVLNVAGNRESKAPGAYQLVYDTLSLVSKSCFQSSKSVFEVLK